MKTAAEIAQQINNETWDEILMAHRGVSAAQLQKVMAEAYQQGCTDAGKLAMSGSAPTTDILTLRDSKKPEMF